MSVFNAVNDKSMSILDLAKIWPLIREFEGTRLQKVSERGNVFYFRFREGGIVFSPRRGLVPAESDSVFPVEFGKTRWSSRIEGKRLESVAQIAGDRVVCLDFGKEKVVLEWVREGNLVLLDGESKIVYALEPKEMRDRTLKPGEKYRSPPRLGDIFSGDIEKLYESFRSMPKRGAIVAFSLVTSLPPDLVAEAMYREGISLDAKAGSLSFSQFRSVATKGIEIFLESLKDPSRGYHAGGWVYSFKPTHVTTDFVEVEFQKAFPEELLRRIIADITPREQTVSSVLEKTLEDYLRKLKLLEENISQIEQIIYDYRALVEDKKPWSLIESTLREKYPSIKKVDPSSPLIVVELEGIEIEIDPSQNVYANIELHYDKIKSIRKRLSEAKTKEEQAKPKQVKQKIAASGPWYTQFRYFWTTNGFLVVAGKSAGQNQLLVRRYLEDKDIFLHADIHGAAAVVVKTGGKDVPEKDILEAAQFAACYSSAWRGGLYTIDVYWVPASQVSLKAPSGEYLAKGSFMIYGKKNYVRGVKLELLIGVNEKGELLALPTERNPTDGCFLKVTPGPYRKDLATRKIIEFLKRECNFKAREEDVVKLLPDGGFHIKRWRPWIPST